MADTIVQQLKRAAVAYYETDKPIMTDAEYDALKEKLEALAPQHPFLQQVGATPTTGRVQLPHFMPSLRKVKPETINSVSLKGPFVVSEKLDGISALWVCGMQKKPQLLLRGDGTTGQDVSHIIKHIQGLRTCGLTASVVVRGELIIPKGKDNDFARGWVNGQVHQTNPDPANLAKIHFVAYSLYQPNNMTRSQQFTWLENQGFEVAWRANLATLDPAALSKMFQERRTGSTYECDGIVVGTDTVPLVTTDATPKDAFAYKEISDDQMAETTVVEVEYAASRKGQWIPRIRVQPVVVGNATIEYCTGHHAQYICENKIGPGARVIIRRSGDVIPKLDTVLVPAATWAEPPAGRWKWDETAVHAVDTSAELDTARLATNMTHSLVAFGVERVSETSARKIVEGGYKTIQELAEAPVGVLQKILGATNGKNLKEALDRVLANATEAQWIYAYPAWPKGFGERKIAATLGVQGDVCRWPTMTTAPAGQTMTTFQEVQKIVPEYLKWRAAFGARGLHAAPVPTPIVAPATPCRGFYVMTGFRDASLQASLQAAGWQLQDTVNKKTNVLLVADNAKETVKVKTAREAGIRIVSRSNAQSLLEPTK
jgi:NAD-dependent DNA ligase